MTFFEKVVPLINKKGVTKNKVTQDLGLSKNAFVDWEKRGNTPSGDIVASLAEYLNTSTDYLLGKTDNPSPLSEIKENPHGLSEEDLHMFEKINAMPKEQQDIIKNLIDQLHSKNNP